MSCRMKGRIFVAVVLVIAAAVLGRQMSGRHHTGSSNDAGREETRQTYALEHGAEVEVRGINGSVEVNTAETETAEVSVVSTAESADDLASSRIVVEHTPSRLVIRGEGNGRRGIWRKLWGAGSVRHKIVLTVPRAVELETKGINGPVKIGELDGSVSVNGINGRVEVAQSVGRSEVKGVNGAVRISVARLGASGMEVQGVNGKVEIQLKEQLNADISVRGLNGNVTLDVPNVTMQEREDRSNMRARLGTGGVPVEITGVNGSVRFESTAPSSSNAVPPVAPVAPVVVTVPDAPHPPHPPTEDEH